MVRHERRAERVIRRGTSSSSWVEQRSDVSCPIVADMLPRRSRRVWRHNQHRSPCWRHTRTIYSPSSSSTQLGLKGSTLGSNAWGGARKPFRRKACEGAKSRDGSRGPSMRLKPGSMPGAGAPAGCCRAPTGVTLRHPMLGSARVRGLNRPACPGPGLKPASLPGPGAYTGQHARARGLNRPACLGPELQPAVVGPLRGLHCDTLC